MDETSNVHSKRLFQLYAPVFCPRRRINTEGVNKGDVFQVHDRKICQLGPLGDSCSSLSELFLVSLSDIFQTLSECVCLQ